MKKKFITTVALIGIMSLSLIACGSDSKENDTTSSINETQATSEQSTSDSSSIDNTNDNSDTNITINESDTDLNSEVEISKLSLIGFKNYLVENNMVDDECWVLYSLLGAYNGFGFDTPSIEVYKYDNLENTNYLTAKNEGYIEFSGNRISVIVNNDLVLYCADVNECTDIIDAFKNFSDPQTDDDIVSDNDDE